ncbi:MAG: DUF4190 domain-containing protein [Planctomycetota bacterium]
MRPHRGTTILVLGILSLVCCGLIGVAPWMMGKDDLEAMQSGQMDPEGKGLTEAGRIIGAIGFGLWALTTLAYVVAIVFFGAVGVAANG